jgi:uncharacterized protein DUF2800
MSAAASIAAVRSVTALVHVRASSMPAAFTCAGSIRAPDIEVDPVNEAATEGTAAHEVMRFIAEGDLQNLDTIDISGIAQRYGVDPDGLRIHGWNGLFMWKHIRAAYIGGAGEINLEAVIAGVRVSGHIDLFTRVGDIAHGADWKFGRLDHNYYHQVAAYMVLILLKYPELHEVLFSICWMRDKDIETYRMTRDGMAAWIASFEAEVVQWNERVFRPGGHCRHCRRSASCPALAAVARRDVEILSEDPSIAERIKNGLGDLKPAELVSLYRRAKAVEAFAKSLQDGVKDYVDRTGQPLQDGEGGELRFVDTDGSRVIDPQTAWPVLQAKLSEDELANAIKISVSKVEAAVADRANAAAVAAGKKPRKGAEAKRDLNVALEAVHAIRRVPGRQFRDQRIK